MATIAPSGPEGNGAIARVFNEFDLVEAVGVRTVNLKAAAKAVARDPRRRTIFLIYAAVVVSFSTTVILLLVSGILGDLYETIWKRWPGRPWTHAMRDHPWIYGLLAIGLGVIPFLLAPRNRWGRAFLTYVMIVIGFLGGHVFW